MNLQIGQECLMSAPMASAEARVSTTAFSLACLVLQLEQLGLLASLIAWKLGSNKYFKVGKHMEQIISYSP